MTQIKAKKICVYLRNLCPNFHRSWCRQGMIPDLKMNETDPCMTDEQAYYASLPKKRMGAGALFVDQQERLLLVNPTYKPQWEIPGGIVEVNESPRSACEREIYEELGLRKRVERLLSISYIATRPQRPDGLMFIFWGGVLTADEIRQIRLPTAELSEYRFVALNEALALLTPALGERVRQSLEIVPTERTLYLEI